MNEQFANAVLATLERIAIAQETTALMLQVLMEDAAVAPPPSAKILMTQAGPIELK